ncbi:hypothetical protein BDF22DRAFT_401996 [Syncephalis plumigaleata]|nr:hypothetical protein BDF22DRAFT_401996 [Syncephalis plumigaleata]
MHLTNSMAYLQPRTQYHPRKASPLRNSVANVGYAAPSPAESQHRRTCTEPHVSLTSHLSPDSSHSTTASSTQFLHLEEFGFLAAGLSNDTTDISYQDILRALDDPSPLPCMDVGPSEDNQTAGTASSSASASVSTSAASRATSPHPHTVVTYLEASEADVGKEDEDRVKRLQRRLTLQQQQFARAFSMSATFSKKQSKRVTIQNTPEAADLVALQSAQSSSTAPAKKSILELFTTTPPATRTPKRQSSMRTLSNRPPNVARRLSADAITPRRSSLSNTGGSSSSNGHNDNDIANITVGQRTSSLIHNMETQSTVSEMASDILSELHNSIMSQSDSQEETDSDDNETNVLDSIYEADRNEDNEEEEEEQEEEGEDDDDEESNGDSSSDDGGTTQLLRRMSVMHVRRCVVAPNERAIRSTSTLETYKPVTIRERALSDATLSEENRADASDERNQLLRRLSVLAESFKSEQQQQHNNNSHHNHHCVHDQNDPHVPVVFI